MNIYNNTAKTASFFTNNEAVLHTVRMRTGHPAQYDEGKNAKFFSKCQKTAQNVKTTRELNR